MSSVEDHKTDTKSMDHGAEEASLAGMPKPPGAADHDDQKEHKGVSDDSTKDNEGPHRGDTGAAKQ